MARIQSIFLTNRFFWGLAGAALLYVIAYFEPLLTPGAHGVLFGLAAGLVVDLVLLFGLGGTVEARRETPKRLSNGDPNPIHLHVRNAYDLSLRCTVLDELPVELQIRDFSLDVTVPPRRTRMLTYTIRPTERGAYEFGAINVYAATALGLVERRFRTEARTEVPVYPSFVRMEQYSLMAASNRLEEVGVKKVRRVGQTMEFDRIREYVPGDDYRSINWKATARRGDLMVNVYRDERAQPVYCILNLGRVMEMPFEGLTLLDHSINASLVLANIALQKHDRAGLLTFADEIGPVVPAGRRSGQIHRLQECLYRLETDFLEANYQRLATYVRANVRRRSLLLLFTNFAATSSLERHLPSLQVLARRHPLVVIFFENTELTALCQCEATRTEEVYVKGMAEKFVFEKKTIVQELRRRGIYTVLTPPEHLSAQTINKYLELKARGVI